MTAADHVHPRLRGPFAARVAVCIFGLWLFALGIVLILHADLGLGPWDALHQGLQKTTPLSFGLANIVVGGVVLLVAMALGVRPGLATILNAVLIGVFIDLMLQFDGLPAPTAVPEKIMWDVLGVLLVGVATALYVGASLGAGPRDSLMLALTWRFGWRVGVSRTAIEIGAAACGYALGGVLGLGTVIFAFGIGPAVEVAFWGLARSPFAQAEVEVEPEPAPA